MATIQHVCTCGCKWQTKDSPSRCSDCGKQSYGQLVRETPKPKRFIKDDEDANVADFDTYDDTRR